MSRHRLSMSQRVCECARESTRVQKGRSRKNVTDSPLPVGYAGLQKCSGHLATGALAHRRELERRQQHLWSARISLASDGPVPASVCVCVCVCVCMCVCV
jgi:hypothetical protein